MHFRIRKGLDLPIKGAPEQRVHDAPAVGSTLRELDVPDGTVIGGFIRGNEAFLPTGDTMIQGRDHLLVVAVPGDIEAVEHLFVR